MERYKKNEAIKVNYIALKKTTGLTDVLMHYYDEAGVEVPTTYPVTMTEVVGAGGLYYGSFTPDAEGQWRIRIQSATNGDDVQRIFEVGTSKVDDVKVQTQSIEDKVDTIDGNVNQALLDVAAVKGVVDTTDGKVDNLDSDVAAVKGVVDGIVTDVAAVKGVVDSTETKVDTAISDIAAVKAVVDDLDLQVNPGGYIL